VKTSKSYMNANMNMYGSVVVKALRYKQGGRGFETQYNEWFLSCKI
jgi:hypothetical protein